MGYLPEAEEEAPKPKSIHTLLKGVGLYSIRMPMAAINRMVAAKAPTVTPLFCVPPIVPCL